MPHRPCGCPCSCSGCWCPNARQAITIVTPAGRFDLTNIADYWDSDLVPPIHADPAWFTGHATYGAFPVPMTAHFN